MVLSHSKYLAKQIKRKLGHQHSLTHAVVPISFHSPSHISPALSVSELMRESEVQDQMHCSLCWTEHNSIPLFLLFFLTLSHFFFFFPPQDLLYFTHWHIFVLQLLALLPLYTDICPPPISHLVFLHALARLPFLPKPITQTIAAGVI